MQREYIVIAPPTVLMNEVFVVPPPDVASTASLRPEEVIAVLGKAYRDQTSQLHQCNINLDGIRNYVEQMSIEVKAMNDGNETKTGGDAPR